MLARNFVAALGGLIRISRRAERDGLTRLDAPQVVAQQFGRMLLHVDLLLELHAVSHFHEFVGVAGIAIATAKFASAIWVDGPCEGHVAVAGAAVQEGTRGQGEIFDVVPFAKGFALGRQPGDANQTRIAGNGK